MDEDIQTWQNNLELCNGVAEGLLKSAISRGMRYSYEHDAMGRLTGKSASGRMLLPYVYDLNGNLYSEYANDALNRLANVEYP